MEIGPILRAMKQNKTKVVVLVLEIAFTVTIVLNCLNMIFDQRQRLIKPSGIDEDDIIAVQVRPFGAQYQEREFLMNLVDRDADALRALPGVIDASSFSPFPLQGGGSSFQLKPLGAPDSDLVRSPIYVADPHFLDTLERRPLGGAGLVGLGRHDGDAPLGALVGLVGPADDIPQRDRINQRPPQLPTYQPKLPETESPTGAYGTPMPTGMMRPVERPAMRFEPQRAPTRLAPRGDQRREIEKDKKDDSQPEKMRLVRSDRRHL